MRHLATGAPIGGSPSQVLPFDPDDPRLIDDPYPTYAALRAESGIHYSPTADAWIVTRHAQVRECLGNWQAFSSTAGVEFSPPIFGPGDPIVNDPPRHDELRDLVSRHFHARSVSALRDPVAARCASILANRDSWDAVDFVTDFADHIPGATMCDILGLPTSDTPWLTGRIHDLLNREQGSTVRERALQARAELWQYFVDAMQASWAGGVDSASLIGDLARAHRGGVISEDEVPGLCLSLIVAGTETTTSLMTTTLFRLMRTDVALGDLMPDGRHVDVRALDEILRFDSPIQWLTRVTTRDVTLDGTLIPAGSRVVLCYASANRDPEVFSDPDTINVQRGQSASLAFGFGVHFCLGRLLSRLEAQIALEAFIARCGVPTPTGDPQRYPSAWLRGFSSLPVSAAVRQP